MVLSVGQVGDNPQQPFIGAETYIPDQLVAGNLKIVSASVTIGGGGILQRGSVMGQSLVGTIAASAGKLFASQTVVLAALPVAADTLTIAATAITFVAANPTGNQVLIGGFGNDDMPVPVPTIAGTATALIDFLVGSTDVNLIKATYSLTGTTITMTAAAVGTGGNALTLATSDATAFTVGGANFTGGTANTGAETIGSLTAGARMKNGNYLVQLTSTTAFTVIDPMGVALAAGTVGTAYLDPQLGFTITTGAAIAAGDQFVIAAGAPSGNYVLAQSGAVDGSQNPSVILADYVDATAGPVIGPVYQMGEFNSNYVTLGNGISLPAATAALRPLGIFLKGVTSAADPS